jgi:hypothetical protein
LTRSTQTKARPMRAWRGTESAARVQAPRLRPSAAVTPARSHQEAQRNSCTQDYEMESSDKRQDGAGWGLPLSWRGSACQQRSMRAVAGLGGSPGGPATWKIVQPLPRANLPRGRACASIRAMAFACAHWRLAQRDFRAPGSQHRPRMKILNMPVRCDTADVTVTTVT